MARRAVLGGLVGGGISAAFGGDFGSGFKRGFTTAAISYTANEFNHLVTPVPKTNLSNNLYEKKLSDQLSIGANPSVTATTADTNKCVFVREVYNGGDEKSCVYKCPGYGAPVAFRQYKDVDCPDILESGLIDTTGLPGRK